MWIRRYKMEEIDTYLIDHLELFNLKVHEAFEYGDITTEQYAWITDTLTTIYKIIKGDDK